MPIRTVIQYRNYPNFTRASVTQAAKVANFAVIDHWHETFAPLHFREDTTSRYSLMPNTLRYQRRKQRVKGHNRHLVWSGYTQRTALRSIRVSGTSKRAAGYLQARVLNFRDKYLDLVKVRQDEANALAKVHRDAQLADLRKRGIRKTVRV